MLLDWPIRTKLKLGLGLLAVTVLALFGSAHYGLYAYRELVKSLSARSAELPLASKVLEHVSDLRATLTQAKERSELEQAFPDASLTDDSAERAASGGSRISDGPWEAKFLAGQFRTQMGLLVDAVDRYRRELEETPVDAASHLADDGGEHATLAKIDRVVDDLQRQPLDEVISKDWFIDRARIGKLLGEVEQLQTLAAELPSHLHQRLHVLSSNVQSQYRTAIIAAWGNAVIALVVLVTSGRMFYVWFANPLQELVAGSRCVAAGRFEHRINLAAHDELGELADAMNAMTDKFCHIRDDLDQQVRERTNQVVRSEQLASVGFLAAGVSHEINNPLASIALCSESLESRMHDLLDSVGPEQAEDVKIARNYLQMIQREAFRCKQITEKLLDFARRGDSQRHTTDLRDLVEGVIEMVQHLGKYQDKSLELTSGVPVLAAVNPQEMKQVMLNLMTNGLESLDAGGRVAVTVDQQGNHVRFIVEDNGCGMTDEVRKHLFEPFYTSRRTGQGIGLGLSITHRIVEEHRGHIDATSRGPGLGSRFVVTLPALETQKEASHRHQAA